MLEDFEPILTEVENRLKSGGIGRACMMDKKPEVTANEQLTPASKAPIPQPSTDGFPIGEDDLTRRVPGGDDKMKEEHPPE